MASATRFTILGPVSTGGQAAVFTALDTETGAIVVLKRSVTRTREQLDRASVEVALLKACQHPNIVQAVAASTSPATEGTGTVVALYMEQCAGGHLLAYAQSRLAQQRPLTEPEIMRLFVQACRAVEHLHRFSPPVAHRDVKLENLLLGGPENRVVKLCDFGSVTTKRWTCATAQERAQLEEEVERYTTPCYRAPELVDLYSKHVVSEQVDIWALGCALYALAYNQHAFGDGSKLAILNGKVAPLSAPYYSDEFRAYFFWLLDANPDTRPRAGDVCDDVDALLGNKIKTPAEKRGSGRGDRSARAMALAAIPAPPKVSPRHARQAPSPAQPAVASSPTRGAAFAAQSAAPRSAANGASAREGAMESRRQRNANAQPILPPVASMQPVRATNPFDDFPPSENPTFFSNPGLKSDSVSGFPTGFYPESGPNLALSPLPGGVAPSHAPIFFSDPPQHYYNNNNAPQTSASNARG